MVLGRQSIGAVVLAMVLAGAGLACAPAAAQQADQNATQAAQNQSLPSAPSAALPSAPAPQTVPQVNTIVPPAPMAPEPPAAADTGDNGGVVPTNHLASSSTAQQPGQQQTPPEIPAAGQAAQAAYTLGAVHVDFVQVPFTVKDSKGRQVPDLSWRDVRVYENGVRQQIKFWSGTDPFPLSVAFVIDQTVTQDTMDKINTALGALQGAFAPYDEVEVYTYNNGVVQQTTFTAAQSPRLAAVLERSKGSGREPMMFLGGPLAQTTTKNNQNVDPNTAPGHGINSIYQTPEKEFHPLFDAIFTAAQSLATVNPTRRRVLYVISDGKEYGSKVKEKELIRYLQTNRIQVFATLVGDSSMPGMGFLDRIHLPLTMRDDALPRIAYATGGQTDPEFRPRGIENSFADLTRTVRTEYTLGYYTHANPLDERFRSVEVVVMRPNLTVDAEKGYYPTPRDVHPAMPVAEKGQSSSQGQPGLQPRTGPPAQPQGAPATTTPPPQP